MAERYRRRLVPGVLATSVAWATAPLAIAVAQPADTPGPAPAAQPEARGLSFGLGSGWAIPFGSRVIGDPVGDTQTGALPIVVNVGYRLNRRVLLGAYFQYGFVFIEPAACRPPLTACAGSDVRAGGEVQVRTRPGKIVDPWFAAGIGYQATTLTIHGAEQTASRTNGGLELLNVKFGLDFPLLGLEAGPFVGWSVGEYTTETVTNPTGPSETFSLAHTSTHYCITLGLRAQYDL